MADDATGAAPTTATVDPWSMTPTQASAALDQKSAQFAAQSVAPVPSAEQVQDADDAAHRLAALTADRDWLAKFTRGSIAERQEYEALTEAIKAGVDETGSIRVGEVETVVGPHGVRRQDLISTIEHLSKVGIPEQGVVRTLTGDFSDEDVEWAQAELDKAMATKEWTDALLRGDPTALHAWTALCAVVSSRKAI
jgi:hypothetical protein